MRRNWSEAFRRISVSWFSKTRSMMNVCQDLSLHKFSKLWGLRATASERTSSASRHSAMSSWLSGAGFSLNGLWSSSIEPFMRLRLPPAEAQASRTMQKTTA